MKFKFIACHNVNGMRRRKRASVREEEGMVNGEETHILLFLGMR